MDPACKEWFPEAGRREEAGLLALGSPDSDPFPCAACRPLCSAGSEPLSGITRTLRVSQPENYTHWDLASLQSLISVIARWDQHIQATQRLHYKPFWI